MRTKKRTHPAPRGKAAQSKPAQSKAMRRSKPIPPTPAAAKRKPKGKAKAKATKAAKGSPGMGIHCSFCGKPENQVSRILSGGGEQPVGVLPVVHICNECIALCNRILLDHPSKRHTPWTLFVTGGERYEWAGFTQDDSSTFMMVRRFNNDQKSFGLVLEPGDQPSTELAKETVLKVPEYF